MQFYRNEYRIDEPRRGLRNSILLVAFLALVVVLVMMIYYFTKVNRPATDESHEVGFVIRTGMTTTGIAESLLEQKVISNKNIFLVYSKLHGVGNKIQAGEYALNSNMTIAEIVDALTKGKVVSDNRNITIVEGWNNRQIGNLLADRGLVTSQSGFDDLLGAENFEFKFSAQAKKFNYEGFLFPDTYTIAKNAGVDELVQKMLKNFENKITDDIISDIAESDYTLGEILTLASIIEKEVGRNKETISDDDLDRMQRERELVASVFYNRLEIGMPLESDATVNYITGKSDRSATIEDTKIKSPYNTYQVRGLPPSPIGNPGLDAIRAAVYPADSDYLFFLNSPDGTAYFAETLAGHNENRAKYLR